MNYINQLILFDEFTKYNYLPNLSQLLWFKLMALNNKCGWAKEFRVNNARLMGEIELHSERTFIKYRQPLIDSGLISFKSGGRNLPSRYTLNELDRGEDGKVIIRERDEDDSIRAEPIIDDKPVIEAEPVQETIKEVKPRPKRKKKTGPTTKDCEMIFKFYNDNRGELRMARKLTEQRKNLIKRVKKDGYTFDDMRQAILKAAASDILTGRKAFNNGGTFKADFDWIFGKKGKFTAILEGNYDNREEKKELSVDDYLAAVGNGLIDIDGTPIENTDTGFTDFEVAEEGTWGEVDISGDPYDWDASAGWTYLEDVSEA